MPVLRAFAVYFTAHGIWKSVPSTDPGDGLRPIGALALAATAVSQTCSVCDLLMLTHIPGGTSIQYAPHR